MKSGPTAPTPFVFPARLDRVRASLARQERALRQVAGWYADALAAGGVVHAYANGHSRIAIEEMAVRLGALAGFHALLADGLTSFVDVVGPSGIRVNQALERVEGLGAVLLDEFEVGAREPLLVVSATGQTAAAVDVAGEWVRRYPDNPLIALCGREQARRGKPKHSSGRTLWHIVRQARHGVLLDNGMPYGDLSVRVRGLRGEYDICPLSSIGALAVVQSLNELTLRELDRRGYVHAVLRNMHTGSTRVNYDTWLRDQRTRYARCLHHPAALAGPEPEAPA